MFNLSLPFVKRKQEQPKNLLGSRKTGGEEEEEKPKRERKKKELPRVWTTQDRIIVAGTLLITLLLGIYFWYRGQGTVPRVHLTIPVPSFEEKIIIE